MAYHLGSERVTIEAEDGPTFEVGPLLAWPITAIAVHRFSKYLAAPDANAQLVALRELYEWFVAEAQPTFAIVDHRGAIPNTTAGLLRLPLDLTLRVIEAWIDTATPQSTAVDEMVPPGPVRDALNAELKSKRRRKEPGGR